MSYIPLIMGAVCVVAFLVLGMKGLVNRKVRRFASEELLTAGYSHVFSGAGMNFVAISLEKKRFRVGTFAWPLSFREYPFVALTDFDWNWTEKEARREQNTFVFTIADIHYPLHKVFYFGKAGQAEYDFAKLRAMFPREGNA